MSLRLYDPPSRPWRVHFASSKGGELGQAIIGGFKDGRGEFFNQETFEGRAILVRFIFSDVTPNSLRLEQAFCSGERGRPRRQPGGADPLRARTPR